VTHAFQPSRITHVADLIRDYPLAWVVSQGPAGHAATPLPLLAETDNEGAVASLFGHFGRSNPHVEIVGRQPEAMILFQGPQGYIPARWVSRPGWGPTWNYAVARFDVEITLVPEENGAALARLAAALERDQPTPWRPDMMGERYAKMEPRIIAFRARVRATHARFKLGQDETSETFAEIIDGLGPGSLSEWMVKTSVDRN